MLIDTHAHLNFKDFNNDFDEVIGRCLAENIWLVSIGSNYETSKKAVEIAEKYKKGVYAAVGLHPIHANNEVFDKEKYKALAQSKKVVAVGEVGLDYYRDYGTFKNKQKKVFLEQLGLARALNLPIIFHCRMAHNDFIEIVSKQLTVNRKQIAGVIHCFTGNWQEAKEYLDMGFYLGINGIMYKLNLKEVIEKTPLEKILIETDSPYLVPPQSGQERNEPVFVKYIAQEIAKIKNLSYKEITETTTKNAKKLFKI